MKDIFGKNTECLKTKKLFLFDMDGTIYNENTLFDGTTELLDKITQTGGKYIFITNNSSRSVMDYVEKVTRMGIKADRESFFTSSQAAALIIKNKYPEVKVYCQGTRSLIKELSDSGIKVTEEIEDDIGLVLLGFDNELTSEKLRKTCYILGRDLPYYGTNCDLRCPVSFGYIPDCGSISIMIKNCTGKEPVFIGKPEPTMIFEAMKKFGASKEETVVIGDRIYTDITSGVNAGVTTVCVLSGEVSLDDVKDSEIKPSLTLGGVKDILESLQ